MSRGKSVRTRAEEVYVSKYGELRYGSYLQIWTSVNLNVMVRHFTEGGDWRDDTLVREVNLGRLNVFDKI